MILNWKLGGLALGLVFFAAVLLVKPIGVSTQFVILDGILWNAVDPDVATQNTDGTYTSTNAYLAKSGGKYAKSVANPMNYSFVFVLAMMFGAFLSSMLKGDRPRSTQSHMPEIWQERFGNKLWKRYVAVFMAGFIVLFGARLAGGCTSGHMMSGMMQTSLSGYLFALGAFAAGIPTAILLFRKHKGEK